MSSLKIKGRQKPKHPPTPYERTKRLVSKVRDWLTPAFWGTPKATRGDEEVDRVEDDESDTDITDQLQQQPGASRVQGKQSDDEMQSDKLNDVAEEGKDDEESFVKEASDEDEGEPAEKRNSEAQLQNLPTGIRTKRVLNNGIRLQQAAAEVTALQLDKKVDQLLSRSRTPVGKSLFTSVDEVQDNNGRTVPMQQTYLSSEASLVDSREGQYHRSSTPTDTTIEPVLPTIPLAVPPMPSSQPIEHLYSQSAICTPVKTDTEESIKNSPFRSPFYHGKTSYGGASALSQPRAKRQKTEPTSSLSQVVHYTVKARSSTEQQPAASQTAKKILKTLETLSTPLSDARKFPLRLTQPGVGQASKHFKQDHTSTVVSSPPTTPLVIPVNHSRLQGPVVVPCLDRGRSQPVAALSNRSEGPSDLSLQRKAEPLLCSPQQGSTGTPLPASTAMPMASLATIKFPSKLDSTCEKSSLPLLNSASSQSGSRPLSASLSNFSSSHKPQPPVSNSSHGLQGFSAAPGGKMKTVSRQHYSASKDEPDVPVNTMELPPPVALTVGPQGSLPRFSFSPGLVMSPLVSTKPVADGTTTSSVGSKPLPAPALNLFSSATSIPKVASSLAGPPPLGQFAFSTPKELAHVSLSYRPKGASQVSTFTFSAPSNRKAIGSSLPYLRPLQAAAPKQAQLPKFAETTKVSPPLLPNKSVLDALKKPEFQPFNRESPFSVAKQEKVIDLTGDENTCDEVAVCKPLQPVAPTLTANFSGFSKAAELKNETLNKSKTETPPQSSLSKQELPVSSQLLTNTSGSGVKIGGGFSASTVSSSQLFSSPIGSLSKMGGPGDLSVGGGLKLEGAKGLPVSSSQPSVVPSGGLKLGGPTLPATSAAVVQESHSEVSLSMASSAASKLPSLTGPLQMPTPPSGSWECGSCMILNKPDTSSCIACGTAGPPKPDVPNQAGVKGLPSLSETKPVAAINPSTEWECQTCLVMNKASDLKCVACSSPKAGTSGGASSIGSGNLFQQKPLAAIPVVLGESGGIKLNLGEGLKIAGITSLSSLTSKKNETQSASFVAMSGSGQPLKSLADGEVKTSDVSGGIKLGFTGALPAFSSTGLQLGLIKSESGEGAKTAEVKPTTQPAFSLGTGKLGVPVGTQFGTDKSGGIEFSKAKSQTSEVGGGEVKFAVPPASQETAQGSSAGGNLSSQPPLTFNLAALTSSTFAGKDASADGGNSQKPFQLTGVSLNCFPALQPNLSASLTTSTESRPVSGISFAVPPLGISATESGATVPGIKLSAPPLQGTASSGLGQGTSSSGLGQGTSSSGLGQGTSLSGLGQGTSLSGLGQGTSLSGFGQGTSSLGLGQGTSSSGFGQGTSLSGFGQGTSLSGLGQGTSLSGRGQGTSGLGLFASQPSALTLSVSISSQPSLAGTAAVAPSVPQSSQLSSSAFGSSLQPSLTFSGTPNPLPVSKSTVSFFGGASSSFSAPSLSASSSSSLFSNAVAAAPSNVTFNFSAGKPSSTADSVAKPGIIASSSMGMVAPPPFKFGSGTSEGTFNFSAGSKTASPAFASNPDPTGKASLFPKAAASGTPTPMMNAAGVRFGAPSLQQMPQGSALSFSATPSFAFSGMTSGQQQQLSSSNVGSGGAALFGAGMGGASIMGQQQQQTPLGTFAPQFGMGSSVLPGGGSGVPSLGGGGAPFASMPGQNTAQNFSGGSSDDSVGMADASGGFGFVPGSGTRVIKKAVRRKN